MAEKRYTREGYLEENYHYFHLRDTAGAERDFHFHEFDKIVLLLAGRVDYTVEDVTYPLRPWDVLLVRHHAIHKALIDRSVPYERVILYLDRKYFERSMPDAHLFSCFDRADAAGQYLLRPDPEQQEHLRGLLDAVENSLHDEAFGAKALCDTYVMQLLICLGRLSSDAEQSELTAAHDLRIAAVLSRINEDPAAPLTVDELAAEAYLSRSHFMRLFRVQTGMSVHAYIRQRRLIRAARLIREGMSAARAAEECGFGDYSAFHRAFVDVFGTGPGTLKK